ncbi:receptor-type tyrosine-protein phosphatase kappa-like [Plakobranchus ocellatus]|uniref:Receptor-type tyrosine-protein phosphatase kappa-like n=1 Tax=Plakobranchus ocellatus TaxID=259542 RepID=A0AAV3Y284_9GAST|nr:receptor-type tyrosine-protein phosphatase kappa-like [Plakobranchus ocellatus]
MNILQSLSEECAFVRHNWRINDADWRNYFCSYHLMYICERPINSSVLLLRPHLPLPEEDWACPVGKFGRECENDCNCANRQEPCFASTGGCVSGCAPGYTGGDCWTRKGEATQSCTVTSHYLYGKRHEERFALCLLSSYRQSATRDLILLHVKKIDLAAILVLAMPT